MQRHLLRSRAPPNPRDNFSFVIWFLACFHSTRHPLHPVLLWSRDSHPHNPFSLSGKLLKHPGSHRNFLSFLILEVILHLHHVNLVLAAWLTPQIVWHWARCPQQRTEGRTPPQELLQEVHGLPPPEYVHPGPSRSKTHRAVPSSNAKSIAPNARSVTPLTFPTIREGRPCSIFSISCDFSGALEFRRRTSSPYSPTCYFRWPCFTWAAERLRISSINCINWWPCCKRICSWIFKRTKWQCGISQLLAYGSETPTVPSQWDLNCTRQANRVAATSKSMRYATVRYDMRGAYVTSSNHAKQRLR